LPFDDKYGDREFDRKLHAQGLRRLFLHAHQLTFANPSTGEIQTVKAPLSAEQNIPQKNSDYKLNYSLP
jgi:23S rRNA pseudouridine955/2504/2580 synthase